jgi:hypothetical protein
VPWPPVAIEHDGSATPMPLYPGAAVVQAATPRTTRNARSGCRRESNAVENARCGIMDRHNVFHRRSDEALS